MTVSKEDRFEDVNRALRLIVQAVGDQAIDAVQINSAEPPFDKIMSTTWFEMRGGRWIEKVDVINSTSYWITGRGWREAVRVAGLADDPDFKAKLGQLAAALKNKVKGRRQEAHVTVDEAADAAGVSRDFVYNAIEGQLIDEVFGMVGANWSLTGAKHGTLIRIPQTFGHRSE